MRNFSDEIIGQSRHQFIYGENGKRREEILRGIVLDNPIVCDQNVRKSTSDVRIGHINGRSLAK